MQVMRGRSGPGMNAVVGAIADLCLCRAVFLYMCACGRVTVHVLRGCPPPRRVGEASHVLAEKELLQPSAVPRALMQVILPMSLRSPCITCPLGSPLLLCKKERYPLQRGHVEGIGSIVGMQPYNGGVEV